MYKGLSLNFNSDEISCFIGNENLKKIKSINLERRKRIKFLENNLDKKSIFIICKPKNMKQYSPFFLTLKIKEKYKKKNKIIKQKIAKFDLKINLYYQECVFLWKNYHQYLKINKEDIKNINNFYKSSFNLLFHEKTTYEELKKTAKILNSISRKYMK